jgi:hypothetical protein
MVVVNDYGPAGAVRVGAMRLHVMLLDRDVRVTDLAGQLPGAGVV